MKDNAVYKAKATFMGHYGEPELEIEVPRSAFKNGSFRVKMTFDIFKKQWIKVTEKDSNQAVKFVSTGAKTVEVKNLAPKAAVAPKRAQSKAPAAAPKRTNLAAPAKKAPARSNSSSSRTTNSTAASKSPIIGGQHAFGHLFDKDVQ